MSYAKACVGAAIMPNLGLVSPLPEFLAAASSSVYFEDPTGLPVKAVTAYPHPRQRWWRRNRATALPVAAPLKVLRSRISSPCLRDFSNTNSADGQSHLAMQALVGSSPAASRRKICLAGADPRTVPIRRSHNYNGWPKNYVSGHDDAFNVIGVRFHWPPTTRVESLSRGPRSE